MTSGLVALHKSNIFHRDLKSLNLLVTQEWHIKLADFGLSRFNTNDNMDTMKQMRGTFAYVDPEVYNNGTFTAASDIYSMGASLFLSREKTFPIRTDMRAPFTLPHSVDSVCDHFPLSHFALRNHLLGGGKPRGHWTLRAAL